MEHSESIIDLRLLELLDLLFIDLYYLQADFRALANFESVSFEAAILIEAILG